MSQSVIQKACKLTFRGNIYQIDLLKTLPRGFTCSKVSNITNGGKEPTHKARPHTHRHLDMQINTQTSGGAEVFAGCSKAAGPVDIDGCNSELVPSASSDVSQLDAFLCSLRDRWGWGEQTTGVRVYTGSQPHVSVLPHHSSVFLIAKLSKTP